MPTTMLEQRLKARSFLADSGCILWTGTQINHDKNGVGYGKISVAGKQLYTHRLAYEMAHGEIPHGLFVCHKCDNRNCINPEHMFLGTNADNMADKISKNRHTKGTQNSNAKLTEKDVLAIRQDTRSLAKIAKDYGMSNVAIFDIKKHINWKHVP